MKVQTCLVVALVATFAGCIAQSEAAGKAGQSDPSSLPPIDENEARITGTVTDDSLAPIMGAQVGILKSDPQVVVTTNEAGRFALVGLVPGRYTIQIQQLGYMTVTKQVEALAGQTIDITVALAPISVATGEARLFTIIGEGYFACGADTPVVTWGNLHACLWDNHKPNISFEVSKADFMGLMDEVVWTQSSGLTSQRLSVSIGYRQVCSPFCSTAQSYGAQSAPARCGSTWTPWMRTWRSGLPKTRCR
jgi:hypothetical protein